VELPYYESLFEDSLEVLGIDWIIVFAFFDETGMHTSAPDTVVAAELTCRGTCSWQRVAAGKAKDKTEGRCR